MRFSILFLSCTFLTSGIYAQGRVDGTDSYSGTGFGRNLRAADNNAVHELIESISENYEESFNGIGDLLLEEPADDKGAASAVINTYITYIQNGSIREVLSQSPGYSVKRELSATALDEIFVIRKNKMEDMLNSALKAEQAAKIDDALRYYSWSYYLLQSLPGSDKIMLDDIKLSDWIPFRVEEILDNVSFNRSGMESNSVVLNITYKGEPVTSLDYIYFDGKDWSNIFSAKDGIGILDFSSNVPDEIQVKCECNYLTEAHIDKDISLLVDVLCGPVFQGDTKTVGANERNDLVKSGNHEKIAGTPVGDYSVRNTLTLMSEEESAPYKDRIVRVFRAIDSGNYSSADDLFSLDGLDVYNKLISYGKARVLGDLNSLAFMASNDEVSCRSVPMSFSFRNNNRKFVENVCFVFNSDTLIDGISFGLDQKAADDILYHPKWDEYARKILIEFLENYKTAYALKRIDYLRQIFDDNALIIVGKVSERPELGADSGQKYINNKYVQLYRKSKEEYMEQLEACFKSNEFINIRFAENDIVKAGKGGEIYGIQIKQDYYSTNYGDTGYLFLMVDLNDPKQPVITVRVWMPERDPDFSGLPDFN